MAGFNMLLLKTKQGDTEAMEILLNSYKPLMLALSYINGVFNEDLYQEFQIIFVQIAINKNFS